MKTLTVIAISLLMSAPALAGTNMNCGNGDHGDRFSARNVQAIASRVANPSSSTKKPKKIKGRR